MADIEIKMIDAQYDRIAGRVHAMQIVQGETSKGAILAFCERRAQANVGVPVPGDDTDLRWIVIDGLHVQWDEWLVWDETTSVLDVVTAERFAHWYRKVDA